MARTNMECAGFDYSNFKTSVTDYAYMADTDYYLSAMSASQQAYLAYIDLHLGFLDMDWLSFFFFFKILKGILILIYPISTMLLELDIKDLTPKGLDG